MHTKRYVMLPLLWALALPLLANESTPVDPVAELQDAALNYEAAADASLSIANGLLQARTQESKSPEEAREQNHHRRNRNASLQLQASDQFMAAAGNLDHAARVWNSASQATKEPAAKAYFGRVSRDSTLRATTFIRQAAELAEQAALEYASIEDLRSQVNASHKAGRIREQLATRR
jgi:hypothetical protein